MHALPKSDRQATRACVHIREITCSGSSFARDDARISSYPSYGSGRATPVRTVLPQHRSLGPNEYLLVGLAKLVALVGQNGTRSGSYVKCPSLHGRIRALALPPADDCPAGPSTILFAHTGRVLLVLRR